MVWCDHLHLLFQGGFTREGMIAHSNMSYICQVVLLVWWMKCNDILFCGGQRDHIFACFLSSIFNFLCLVFFMKALQKSPPCFLFPSVFGASSSPPCTCIMAKTFSFLSVSPKTFWTGFVPTMDRDIQWRAPQQLAAQQLLPAAVARRCASQLTHHMTIAHFPLSSLPAPSSWK